MTKKEIIEAAIHGGLYLFGDKDNFDSIPQEYKTDWNIFFDLCNDFPLPRTEQIIEAIKSGLRPQKGEHRTWKYNYPNPPKYTEIPFWYFSVGNKGITNDCLIDFTTCPVTEKYDLANNFLIRFNASRSERYRYYTKHYRSLIFKVYAFKTLPEAWEFLFGFMVSKNVS